MEIEEIEAQIADVDEKIFHAQQAVLIAKESNIKSVKFKPEWTAIVLLLILFADMARMMYSHDTKLSIAAIILISVVLLVYIVYLMTVFIPNGRQKRKNEQEFEERNYILEALLSKRKEIFENFAISNEGKVFRSISREKDLAIWLKDGVLYIAYLANGLQTESFELTSIRYIATDSLLQEYNRRISGYTITAYNAPKNNIDTRINYAYIFFDDNNSIIFPDTAYPYLKTIMPDKELSLILETTVNDKNS